MTDARRSIFFMVGVEPEVQAYAMAKYSRSSQSMLQSVQELSAQRAEQFLNTFYFAYGHRSIADLAMLVVALENISILAAIRVVDEPLWNGQERSTRYQNFKASGFYHPFAAGHPAAEQYDAVGRGMFDAYEALTAELSELLERHVGRPDRMELQTYRRTLRARAFDVARQLLPLATHTSLGQVVSARVLERQICRLLADPLPEAREIAAELRQAATRPAETPTVSYPAPVRAAPTLVKYTSEAAYERRTLEAVRCWAGGRLAALGRPDRGRSVELADDEPPTDELCATLLYRVDEQGHSYRQIQALVRNLGEAEKRELVELSLEHRGPHDELLREHQTGYMVKADILVDLGAYRDLHRHRRCVQIAQPLNADHGVDDPAWVFQRGLGQEAAGEAERTGTVSRYQAALEAAATGARALATTEPRAAQYLFPLASRARVLFKMDLAQSAYIVELRSQPGGHFSFREIAWQLFTHLRERFPPVARSLRVDDPREPPDLLRRGGGMPRRSCWTARSGLEVGLPDTTPNMPALQGWAFRYHRVSRALSLVGHAAPSHGRSRHGFATVDCAATH
ncbi:MAG: FAD-dependent thymidylate synthase [Chloroflexi bacterium]|nr:FAD-dependent thymidylate synthase [Chloroflexota bacterium]